MIIGPTLTEPQHKALQIVNSKKADERNMLENHLGKKLAELDFHIKMGNENLQKLDKQRKTLEEALHRAAGAYEGFVSVLAAHYAEDIPEQPPQNITPMSIDGKKSEVPPDHGDGRKATEFSVPTPATDEPESKEPPTPE